MVLRLRKLGNDGSCARPTSSNYFACLQSLEFERCMQFRRRLMKPSWVDVRYFQRCVTCVYSQKTRKKIDDVIAKWRPEIQASPAMTATQLLGSLPGLAFCDLLHLRRTLADTTPRPPEPPAPSFLRSLEATDVNDLCTICGFDTEPDNLIVYCSSCNMGVHQTCYGISEVCASCVTSCEHPGFEALPSVECGQMVED